MRNRKWLCIIASVLCMLVPAKILAESNWLFNAPGSPQCNSAAICEDKLYVMTNKGLYACSIDGTSAVCAVSDTELAAQGISVDSLVCSGQALMVFDGINNQIWTYENQVFRKKTVLNDTDFNAQNRYAYYRNPVWIGDQLYVLALSDGGEVLDILRVDVENGSVSATEARGTFQLLDYNNGNLIAVRSASSGDHPTNELVILDKQTLTVQEQIAEIDDAYYSYVAFSRTDNLLYTNIDGMLSYLKDGQWQKLRPMPSLANSFGLFFAVEADFAIIAKNSGINIFPIKAEENRKTLSIKGLSMGVNNDDGFTAAHPGITILRDTVPNFSADDAYQEISAKGAETDLYVLRLDYGLMNLMEKGYVAPLTSSMISEYVGRLYPALAQSVQLNGEIYAAPYRLNVFVWMISTEGDQALNAPLTVEEVIEASMDWDDSQLNDGVPYMAEAYSFRPWNQLDYANYIMKQYIMGHDDNAQALKFDDARLRQLLELVHSTVENQQVSATGTDNSISEKMGSILVANQLVSAANSPYEDADLMTPPSILPGETAHIPAGFYVYILNPYSQNKNEATEFIEYDLSNRSADENAMMYQDITEGSLLRSATEIIDEIQAELEKMNQRYEKADAEHKREIQDSIQGLENELIQVCESKDSWVVYEPTLNAYRQKIAPYLDLGLSAYLGVSSDSSAYGQLMSHVQRYLDGAISLEDCIHKLDTLSSLIYRESMDGNH